MRIITVTLNPAIDLTGSLGQLALGEVNLVDTASRRPAGKGINVANVLAQVGEPITVTGFLGADNSGEFEQLFSELGLTDAFVRVPGNTRVNVKLAEADGRVSDVNFPGFEVSNEAQQALLDQVNALSGPDSLVVIAGSLPRGVEASYMTSLISTVKAAGGRVILDTSGEALKAGLAAGPDLAKPNLEELSVLVGREVGLGELPQLASELLPAESQTLVVSAGADGLYTFGGLGQLHLQPPRVTVASTVGAGDTLVAGLCWMLSDSSTAEHGLRRACALAAHAVTQHGVTVPTPEALQTLIEQVVFD